MDDRPIEKKRIRIFFGGFKYDGYLVGEDDQVYIIDDFKDGRIRLPKSGSVLHEEVKG